MAVGRWLRRKHKEARLHAKMSQGGGAAHNSRKNQKPAAPRKDATGTPSSK